MLKAIHRMQRDERGFTLVELLIVIAIIAILAAIAIPQFSSYRAKAGKAACQSDVKNCINTCAAALADNPAATSCPTCKASASCGTNEVTVTLTNGVVTAASVTGTGSYQGTCSLNTTNNSIECT